MRLAVVAALVLLAVAVRAEGDDTVALTADTFEKTITENPYVLVEFFAPWCGHCKRLAPEYAKAATILKEDGIVLATVDATVEKDLAGQFKVRGYPTLKLFKNGQATDYNGGRTTDTIVSYIRKATGPPAKQLADQAEVDSFKDSGEVVVIGFFAEASGAEYDAFTATASADEKLTYGYTTDAAAAQAFGASVPGIVLFKKFDELKNVHSGDMSQTAITEFIQTNSIPLVIPFTMERVADVFQSAIGKVAFLFTNEENPAFREVAEANRGKLVFVTADSSNSRLNSHIGVTEADFPVLYILETASQLVKYPLQGAPSKDAMEKHIAAFFSGELKPHFKSEPVPADNSGPVTVVVGDNFESIVMDETKDVLLEVYAPWCGHCKKLEPIYNDLGEAYKSNPNVVIAKMDGTANEVKDLAIRGFPTLKFYPAGSKKSAVGTDYQGGRELDDFKKYIEANGKAAAAPAKDEL